MSRKIHHTAVAIVPPEGLWEPIQAIRREHDRQIHRWMPHINLLYPFRPQDEFAAMTPNLVTACAAVTSFGITLGEFRFFRHGSGRCTLWLAPEPVEVLRELQAALQTVCPDCDDLSRFASDFTPHLSVGQFPSRRDCEQIREQLQASRQPVRFVLTDVAVLTRSAASPLVVERRVALAGEHQGARPEAER